MEMADGDTAVSLASAVYVAIGAQRVVAERAESCLLVPAVGDDVLVAASGGSHQLIAVLRRSSAAPRTWASPAEADVTLRAGKLTFAGHKAIVAHCDKLDVVARDSRFISRSLNVVSHAIDATSDTLKWIGQQLQSVSRSSAHSCHSYTRCVASGDVVNSQHMVRNASGCATTSANHVLVDGRHDIRMDANRIHMG